MKLSLALLVVPLSTTTAIAQVPLPVEKSATWDSEAMVFTLEGRVRIEKRIDLESQRGMTLRGQGEGATLVVAGSFTAKAVTGGTNLFENLTIELDPECRELYLANVTWKGGGGIRTAKGAPIAAKIYCEYVSLQDSAGFEVEATGGSIDLQASSVYAPVAIRGVVPEKKKKNGTKVEILTCKGGLSGGLTLTDLADVTVRNNALAGPRILLERIAKLDFDGNLVRADALELVVDRFEGFADTELHNCDFAAGSVRIFAPAKEKESDERKKLPFDHCWFRGLTDPDVIRREVVNDALRQEGCGVLASFPRVSPAPLGLGGWVDK